jgi:hypothetical protein
MGDLGRLWLKTGVVLAAYSLDAVILGLMNKHAA